MLENGSWPLDNETNGSEVDCSYYSPVDTTKLVMVMIVGTTVATVSLVENLFLFFIFARQREIYRSNLIYPLTLSLLDFIISSSYILLMSWAVFMDYYDSLTLYFAWISYLQVTFVISHVSMASSSFLIVFWTLERWLCIVRVSDVLSSPLRRGGAVVVAVLLGMAFKGQIYWELFVQEVPECENQARFFVRQSPLAANKIYNTVFMFYMRNSVTVFLPFVVLATLNISIIRHLRRTTQAARVARQVPGLSPSISSRCLIYLRSTLLALSKLRYSTQAPAPQWSKPYHYVDSVLFESGFCPTYSGF